MSEKLERRRTSIPGYTPLFYNGHLVDMDTRLPAYGIDLQLIKQMYQDPSPFPCVPIEPEFVKKWKYMFELTNFANEHWMPRHQHLTVVELQQEIDKRSY